MWNILGISGTSLPLCQVFFAGSSNFEGLMETGDECVIGGQ